jgi:hypothetical protein
MQSVASIHLFSAFIRRNIHDDTTCTTRRYAFISFEGRLKNPKQTCFAPKQATRSRHVSRVDLAPSVLWCNQQTESRLILRSKSKNRRGYFEAQIIKLELPVLMTKSENCRPWF